MNIRRHIRENISFPMACAPLRAVFNTIYPINIIVHGLDGGLAVTIYDTSKPMDDGPGDEIGSDWVTTWITDADTDAQLQASIREKAAALIERTRYYA